MLAVVLALLTLQAPGPAQADELFALGNRLYAEGDFRGAAAAYEGARETGWTSPELELGLGAAYVEAGALGRGVLHFERARRLAPRDPAVQHNLALVRSRVGTDSVSLAPAAAAARWLSLRIGSGGLALVAFVLYAAALALLGVRLWADARAAWLRRTLIVLVPLALFVSVAAVLTARYETQPRAVVVAAEAPVRTAPTASSPSAETAPEGTVLPVTGARGPWRSVRLPDGTAGWAEAAALEEI